MQKRMPCIITAERAEGRAVAALLRNARRTRLGEFAVWTGTVEDTNVLVLTGARGAEKAGRAVEVLTVEFGDATFIKFGAAGAMSPDLKINDIVIPHTILRLDLPENSRLDSVETLLRDSVNVSKSFIHIARTLPVCISESAAEIDGTLCSRRIRDFLFKDYEISTVDCESYTVVKTAVTLGREGAVVHVITDYADENAVRDCKQNIRRSTEIGTELLLNLIKGLKTKLDW